MSDWIRHSYRPCLGCGYCCKKVICVLGKEIAGRCKELYWNDGQEMYRCRLIEEDEAFGKALSAGEGCCSSLNSWRKDVKNRG